MLTPYKSKPHAYPTLVRMAVMVWCEAEEQLDISNKALAVDDFETYSIARRTYDIKMELHYAYRNAIRATFDIDDEAVTIDIMLQKELFKQGGASHV